jgi:hypothetical protein
MRGPMLSRSRHWRDDPYSESQWYAPRHGSRRQKWWSDPRTIRRREGRAWRREQRNET